MSIVKPNSADEVVRSLGNDPQYNSPAIGPHAGVSKKGTGPGMSRTFRQKSDIPPEKYFLGNDSSGHSYVVPLNRRDEFALWALLSPADPMSWSVPDWAYEIKDRLLIFTNPDLE